MRVLLHNQRVWDAWFFGSLLVALFGFIAFGLWFIKSDTQRALDLSTIRTVSQVKAEMERMRLEQLEADREREQLRQTVQPLRGLSKAIEAVKDATEPVKEGRP